MDKPYTIEPIKDLRGRKITGYRVKQGAREWCAKTAKEALALRESAIEQACADRHDPIVLSNGVDTWIGYFSFSDGWRYGRISDKTPNCQHEMYGSGNYATRKECERYMRCNAASQSYKLGDGPDFAVVDDACDFLRSSAVNPSDIVDHLVSLAWQRGARIAKAQGYEVNVNPNSAGDVIADGVKRAESDRVYDLYRAAKYNAGFDWIEYLREKK
jgi:hypothetical protein